MGDGASKNTPQDWETRMIDVHKIDPDSGLPSELRWYFCSNELVPPPDAQRLFERSPGYETLDLAFWIPHDKGLFFL